MKIIALALGSLLAFTPLAARAEPPAPSDPPSASVEAPKPRREWYGWQTLLADGASFGLVIAGTHSGGGLLVAGGTSYALAAPLIHAAHANDGAAGISVALRLGLPLAGGLIGSAAVPYKEGAHYSDGYVDDSYGQLFAVLGGVALGMLAASIVDASFLAYDQHATAPASPKPDTKAFRIAPSVGPLRGGLSAGLTGTF
jgi:hypothetical protein